MMKKTITAISMGVLLATSVPAFADRHWEGHEIHRFGERDLRVWRGGHWYHGRHGGRAGWWWIAAGTWYFYPAPVYPYPDPYVPPVAVVPVAPQPPVVVAPQPQTVVPAQPAPQYWYYCDSAKGYYPYVPTCPESWRPVAAQPAPGAPR